MSQHLGRPVVLSETSHHDGHPGHRYADKGAWLRYVVSQCDSAARHGHPVHGICWYPAIDSPAWNGRRGEFWSHGLFKLDGSMDQTLAQAIGDHVAIPAADERAS